MHIILSVVSIVSGLILVVGLHELGHAIAAYWLGVKVKRISIGFGKPLLLWKDNRCIEWVWAMWPLGGFVQLCNTRIDKVNPGDESRCFDKKPVWVRVLILMSGAFANVLVAWIALTAMLIIGFRQTPPVIVNVIPSSLAAQAGLKSGEQVVKMRGRDTTSWQDVNKQLVMGFGKPISIVVEDTRGVRHQCLLKLNLWQYTHQENLLLSIGLQPDASKVNTRLVPGISLRPALQQAFIKVCQILEFYVILLKQLITGAIPFGLLLGPLGLFLALIDSFYQGLTVFLYFIANLSLAVGLVNLLPVPGLDGALIVYALVEKAIRKPLSIAFEVLLYRLGFIGICLFLFQLCLNDLRQFGWS